MKYEMIFGDYEFASSTCEIAVRSGYGDILEMSLIAPIVIPDEWGVIAMRRIIKEPKRWTWEDKKAGRLPEVGSDVLFGKKGKHDIKIAEFIGTGTIDSVWCLKLRCGSYVFVESEIVNPIETPAEKAQREEDEFIDSLKSVEIHDGTVSSFFNQGARAAYRKLKGGE